MKKRIKKSKYIKAGLAFFLATVWYASDNKTFASNDNHGYSFEIQPYHYNNYSAKRYRQTTHVENEWKVNLISSGEGKGTITTFWLGKYNDDAFYNYEQGSITRNIKQGSGNHYTEAYSKANKSYVALGAENNNYTTNTYWVSGNWDEEVW